MQFLYGQASLQYVYTSEYVVVYRLEGGHLWSTNIILCATVCGRGWIPLEQNKRTNKQSMLRMEQAKADSGASVMGERQKSELNATLSARRDRDSSVRESYAQRRRYPTVSF